MKIQKILCHRLSFENFKFIDGWSLQIFPKFKQYFSFIKKLFPFISKRIQSQIFKTIKIWSSYWSPRQLMGSPTSTVFLIAHHKKITCSFCLILKKLLKGHTTKTVFHNGIHYYEKGGFSSGLNSQLGKWKYTQIIRWGIPLTAPPAETV